MSINTHPLPDVTSCETPDRPNRLKWVGMEGIALPIDISTLCTDPPRAIAKTDVYVSLDKPETKGIHMSRLYKSLLELGNTPLSHDVIYKKLHEMVYGQQGISESARLALTFDLLIKRPALVSKETGYQAYPIVISSDLEQGACVHTISITLPYSSTCPCSAALSRDLTAQAVDNTFQGDQINKEGLLTWLRSAEGSIATPHSQRSFAYLKMKLRQNEWLDIPLAIHTLENLIATPVQTAVKREDEQAFAHLNAKNLMFCEDAARRIKGYLERLEMIEDYWFKVEHQESLHAHNAVVIDYTSAGLGL